MTDFITYEQWQLYNIAMKQGYVEAPFEINYDSYSNEMKSKRVPRMPDE